MVTDRTGLNVRLQESGDTEIRIAIESSEGEELNAYNLTVRKTLPRGRLVGYWNFDEISAEGIVKDQSGMGNDGNVYAAELVPGKTGHALRFSGGYVDVNHAKGLDFGDGDFTVSLWVKPERLDEFMTLLWYGDVGAGAKGWYVRTQQHDRLFFRTGGDGSETLAGTGKPVLAAGRWTHVAARKKGHVMNILIDGREALTKVSTLNYNINGEARLRIGMPKSGSSRAWAGLIDEVRIYNYALSDEEIQRLYDEWK
jgi:sialidase-1